MQVNASASAPSSATLAAVLAPPSTGTGYEPTPYTPPAPPKPAAPPPARRPRAARFQTLDMWRGVACILVVIYHSTTVHVGHTPYGFPLLEAATAGEFFLALTRCLWIGVPMFFVISGYCISATADAANLKRRPIGDYFLRRFRRIFPPYWAAIALQLAILLAVDSVLLPGVLTKGEMPLQQPSGLTAWQWLGNLTLTESWRFQVVGEQMRYVLGQAWTLCYEEQFYAVTGLILLCAPRHFFRAALLVTIGTLLIKHGTRRFDLDSTGFFFDGRWFMFAAGIFIYYVRNYGTRLASGAAAATLLLGLAYGLREEDVHLVTAFSFALLLLATHRWDVQLTGYKALRPLAFLGMICYSLYLTHIPVVRLVSQLAYNNGLRSDWAVVLIVAPLASGAALLLGWGFYSMVERRFLNPSHV